MHHLSTNSFSGKRNSATLNVHVDCKVYLEFRNVKMRGSVGVLELQENKKGFLK